MAAPGAASDDGVSLEEEVLQPFSSSSFAFLTASSSSALRSDTISGNLTVAIKSLEI